MTPEEERWAQAALVYRQHGDPLLPLITTDPMEQIIERALQEAGIRYITDHGGGTSHRLDFELPDHGVAIGVKRMHTPRVAEQMARFPDVIVGQGKVAVQLLADAIRSDKIIEMRETA